jgi:hypothetical protein
MPPAELAKSGIAKWRSFVASTLTVERISIVDGQLFHGGLTALLLLEADADLLAAYWREVVAVIKPLNPLLIYFHQDDVDSAIRAVSARRGEKWVNYQVNWKLQSPYARRRGLAGLDGLITLYRQYRALTDQLFANSIFRMRIENSRQEWAIYDDIIDRADEREHDFIETDLGVPEDAPKRMDPRLAWSATRLASETAIDSPRIESVIAV